MAMDNLEREEISNKTEIEKLLEEIKNAALGFENYKQFFDKIKNSDQVIMTQIENLQREYREYKIRFTEGFNKENHKSLVEDGFVRLEVFEDNRQMVKILIEAYAWKTLQQELFSIIFKKIYTVLDDARAMDIKRDALKEMREMEERRHAMFVEIMGNMAGMFRDYVVNKLQNYDDKFINLVMLMDEDNRKDRKTLFDTLKKIVTEMNAIEMEKREKVIEEMELNQESKAKRLYPQGRVPIDIEFRKKEREINAARPSTTKKKSDEDLEDSADELMKKFKKNSKMDDINQKVDAYDMDGKDDEEDDF